MKENTEILFSIMGKTNEVSSRRGEESRYPRLRPQRISEKRIPTELLTLGILERANRGPPE